ncbi:hypothetical protein ISS03_00040 [Patescibacteria group bacterium]|nr:hypothetical protein [Patescibacteria group bacterium]
MKTLFINKIFFLLALTFLASFSVAKANTSDNVYGWAWAGNFGWISFNCTNTFTCGSVNYGVNVEPMTGDFEGYAWSPNLGWISFQENGYSSAAGFFDGCIEESSCDSNDQNSCSACYNFIDNKVYGWAKILSLGDSGWIRFDHDGGTGTDLYNLRAESDTGFFRGYGWNGNNTNSDLASEVGVGWISFNCEDDPAGCSNPLIIGYRVVGDFVNNKPELANLSAPNWSFEEGCSGYGSLQTFLEWDFSDRDAGGCELAYQIIVNTTNSTSSPVLDTGKCLGTYSGGVCSGGYDGSACQTTVVANRFNLKAALANGGASSTAELEYGTPYYWWIKVWDEREKESDWFQFNTDSALNHVVTDNIAGNLAESFDPNLTFTTYYHKFPNPSFSWLPTYPNIGENVYFTDNTKYYKTETGDNQHTCNDTFCNYEWTFEQALPNTSMSMAPSEIKFLQGGSMNVVVKVTDNEGYYCYNSANVENVSVCLPLWQEKRP